MRATDPVVTFLLVLVIGIVAGILFTGWPAHPGSPASSPDRPAALSPVPSWVLLARSSAITSLCCLRLVADC